MTELRPLLLAWADDLFLAGHQMGRWIVDYVELEESLAVGSIGQEQLGHARELLAVCGLDVSARDGRLFDRPAAEWNPSGLVAVRGGDDWAELVASSYVLAAATLALLDVDVASGAAAALAVIRPEQALHLEHWQRWLALLRADAETAPRLEAALERTATCGDDLLAAVPGATVDLEAVRGAFAGRLTEDGIAAPERFFARAAREPARHAAAIAPVVADLRAVRDRYATVALEVES
jgi:1,2-phenylacetyl-CoA epoxidase catalytic subunit